jgi:hypothetical protein
MFQSRKFLHIYSYRDIDNILSSIDKIRYDLEIKGLFNLLKKSFWKWSLSNCIEKLKNLNKEYKEYFYKILHKKLNKWNYIYKSNRSKALNYIKHHKDFPTINIIKK